jgi:hypothetical protein
LGASRGKKKKDDATTAGGAKQPAAKANPVGGQGVNKNLWSGIGKAMAKAALPFKKGGPVKKTGLAIVHKGEYVVPAKRRSTKRGSKASSPKRVMVKL